MKKKKQLYPIILKYSVKLMLFNLIHLWLHIFQLEKVVFFFSSQGGKEIMFYSFSFHPHFLSNGIWPKSVDLFFLNEDVLGGQDPQRSHSQTLPPESVGRRGWGHEGEAGIFLPDRRKKLIWFVPIQHVLGVYSCLLWCSKHLDNL